VFILAKDNIKIGLALGLLAPALGFLGFYLFHFYPASFIDFVHRIAHEKPLVTAVSSFSLLANAVIFTIYINLHKDHTARGVFIITCGYSVTILIYKLFL
jgi:hypothetical protein